jgi:hypothetical protein
MASVTPVQHRSPSSPRPPLVLVGRSGQKVGSYTLIEPLGTGGMGEVWLAEHGLLQRLAAVKLIRADASSPSGSEQARKRFEREARATSALRSPHTVAIYDFGVTAGQTFYYAMELLEGIGLDALVETCGRVPPARAVHLLLGACASLAEAHQRGLVHRDIKPSNIFACAMGLTYDFVKVLDFGLVKQVAAAGALTSLTASGAIAGSPAFMPPEAVKGEFTPKADVYSLGCVAYWLLTSRLVFNGVTAFEMMLAHSHVEPERPSRHLTEPLPAALEALVIACLAKKPEDRPSIGEVAARLSEVSATLPWTPADAEAWWMVHQAELASAKLLLNEAQRERMRGDALALPKRAEWTERERAAHVDAGLARLQQHFLQSHIDMPNLEMRIALVKKATAPSSFELVFADLPGLPAALPVLETSRLDRASGRARMVARSERALMRPAEHVLCVMTHLVRQCAIEPDKELHVLSLMGYCSLNLSGGSSVGGHMWINCLAVMGGLEITVPADARVEIATSGLLGSDEQQGSFAANVPGERTVLHLRGSAFMGLVLIRVIDGALAPT